jgi:hypothetical protein
MPEPLAPDIVVFDHLVDSDWVFYAAEGDKVRRRADAMKRFGVRRRETFRTEQRFRDYAELLAKVTVQGAVTIQRAQHFAGATNIVIPMSYELAVLWQELGFKQRLWQAFRWWRHRTRIEDELRNRLGRGQ